MADEPLKQALRAANAELLRRLEELSFVRLVGDALAGETTTAGVGRALVELLRAELGVELVALWEVDALDAGVRLAARFGPDDAAPAIPGNGPLVAFAAAGALGRAAAGEAVGVVSGTDVPAGADGVAALALHPLRARGRVLAVLGIGVRSGTIDDAERERLVGLVAPVVSLALESAALAERLASENRTLRAELGDRFGRAALVGVSPAFRRLLAAVERLAEADVTVLILGESGTGKELVARALHWGGRRRDCPFVALNCAALPESLLESELFGIERGVATGVERRAGLVERATGGTLFLDEIGDMTLAVQAKLLRVLQEREVMRVGGARPIPVDVRVVAATHRDLEAEVRAGRFREDLYFRLKVATLRIPALRERPEDLPLLAQHFLARFAARHERPGLRFAPDGLAALSTRPWPGNVRELENAIEQAVVMAAGTTIGAEELGFEAPAPAVEGHEYRAAVRAVVGDTERSLIERALNECGQNRTRAARLLGIGRRTLLYKLKRYGLGAS